MNYNENTFPVNSSEYWEKRFASNDWSKFDGDKQSLFFAELALMAMPQWLKHELSTNEWTVADLGCADGSGTAALARHLPRCKFTGYDFSESAISSATTKYPFCKFQVSDITNEPIKSSDIIFSSNTLEHLPQPIDILKKFCAAANKYTIILLPYDDVSGHPEHFSIFTRDSFPIAFPSHCLAGFRIIDCAALNSPYWQGKQILLVYVNEQFKTMEHISIEQIFQSNFSELEQLENLRNEQVALHAKLAEQNQHLSNAVTHQQELAEKIVTLEAQSASYLLQKETAEAAIHKAEELAKSQVAVAQMQVDETLKNAAAAQEQIKILKEVEEALSMHSTDLEKKYKESLAEQEQLADHIYQIHEAAEEMQKRYLWLQQKMNSVQIACNDLCSSRSSKLLHFLTRTKHQLLLGTMKEKYQYFQWLLARRKQNHNDNGWNVFHTLSKMLQDNDQIQNLSLPQIPHLLESSPNFSKKVNPHLMKPYTKYDVIILSVIDFGFRYQRPQHFASMFVENGHRVFYINANFHQPKAINEVKPNLFAINFFNPQHPAIYGTDWSDQMDLLKASFCEVLAPFAVRDAVVIVEYPHWIYAAEYLKQQYGFRIVTDYLDDFTGFLNPGEDHLKANCTALLSKSDAIAASSQFLYDIAAKYNHQCHIVRNGTEFAHFNRADHPSDIRSRKIIGYYGAVAHWFDYKKVCYLAQKLPDCEIQIIGDVTANREALSKHENIHLLGEKPYQELPDYLQNFNVCLIPFDTSTDLIRATNPVKFYEYLSAGKKIVATEIPELLPFRDKYVYMSNDNDTFLKYVQMCLDGADTLCNSQDLIEMGRQHDWHERYRQMQDICANLHPTITIIVLTYNNLVLNELCIDRILQHTAYPQYELLVVDNASSDGTTDYLRELAERDIPKLRVIFNEKNIGFAAGNNVGIRACDSDYVVLLNNDTLITRGWLTSMVKHLEQREKTGMCGPVTNSIGNEARINAKYHTISEMAHFADNYTWKHMSKTWDNPNVLAMFCVMIPRKVIEQCGLLDESYKLGMFEDDDYAQAVMAAGYQLCIAEDAFVHHFDGASFKKMESESYRKLFKKNKELFERKWNTTWQMHHYRPGVIADRLEDSKISVD